MEAYSRLQLLPALAALAALRGFVYNKMHANAVQIQSSVMAIRTADGRIKGRRTDRQDGHTYIRRSNEAGALRLRVSSAATVE
jgi:hypothetical protein